MQSVYYITVQYWKVLQIRKVYYYMRGFEAPSERRGLILIAIHQLQNLFLIFFILRGEKNHQQSSVPYTYTSMGPKTAL